MSLRINVPRIFQMPSQTLRASGVYLSGAFYSLAFFLMLDTALWSAHMNNSPHTVGFIDWLPLLLGSLGMAVINLVEKQRLNGGATFGSEYGGPNDTWQAKIVLFLGFAFLSGGLAGSILILVLRYLINKKHYWPILRMGVLNVISSVCVLASCLTLWVAQNVEDEYSYSLQL